MIGEVIIAVLSEKKKKEGEKSEGSHGEKKDRGTEE